MTGLASRWPHAPAGSHCHPAVTRCNLFSSLCAVSPGNRNVSATGFQASRSMSASARHRMNSADAKRQESVSSAFKSSTHQIEPIRKAIRSDKFAKNARSIPKGMSPGLAARHRNNAAESNGAARRSLPHAWELPCHDSFVIGLMLLCLPLPACSGSTWDQGKAPCSGACPVRRW